MYKFHEMKNQHATNFTKKTARSKFYEQNPFYEDENKCTSFTKRKINMQQVSRTKIGMQQVPGTKSVSGGEKSMCKFHEKKNQLATSFTKKISP